MNDELVTTSRLFHEKLLELISSNMVRDPRSEECELEVDQAIHSVRSNELTGPYLVYFDDETLTELLENLLDLQEEIRVAEQAIVYLIDNSMFHHANHKLISKLNSKLG